MRIMRYVAMQVIGAVMLVFGASMQDMLIVISGAVLAGVGLLAMTVDR